MKSGTITITVGKNVESLRRTIPSEEDGKRYINQFLLFGSADELYDQAPSRGTWEFSFVFLDPEKGKQQRPNPSAGFRHASLGHLAALANQHPELIGNETVLATESFAHIDGMFPACPALIRKGKKVFVTCCSGGAPKGTTKFLCVGEGKRVC